MHIQLKSGFHLEECQYNVNINAIANSLFLYYDMTSVPEHRCIPSRRRFHPTTD